MRELRPAASRSTTWRTIVGTPLHRHSKMVAWPVTEAGTASFDGRGTRRVINVIAAVGGRSVSVDPPLADATATGTVDGGVIRERVESPSGFAHTAPIEKASVELTLELGRDPAPQQRRLNIIVDSTGDVLTVRFTTSTLVRSTSWVRWTVRRRPIGFN